ncbi:MAG TPA: DinB family protein [Terriglobales bacterium]|nr:DinB family protein [Terriglobales bacterium]
MNKQDIQLLYKYDRWANHRVLQSAATLSQEQFTRDLGGSFRSVRDTIVHISAGEWIWLTYWNLPSPAFAELVALRTKRDALFQPDLFLDLNAVREKWAEVEKQQIEFVDSVTDALLEKMLPYRDTELKLAQLMQHMANHSTYHRGQISLMMRQLKADPMATDFHVFLAENK